jgi:CRP-like cAMP-binding protein
MPSTEALHHCGLFTELDDAELKLIGSLCHVKEYQEGETIFAAQERAEELYILEEGRVALQIHLRSGVEASGDVTIEDLQPGNIFGWSSVVKQQRFTATARALEPVRVCAIRASELNALFNQNAHIGFVVMKQMANIISSRLRRTRAELEERASAGE